MTCINEMTTKDGLSFECKKTEIDSVKSDGVSIQIVGPSNATSINLPLEVFLEFADFVEDTRGRLLQEDAAS